MQITRGERGEDTVWLLFRFLLPSDIVRLKDIRRKSTEERKDSPDAARILKKGG